MGPPLARTDEERTLTVSCRGLCVLVVWLLAAAAAHAEIRLFVAPPTAAAAGAEATTVWVYFCNDAAQGAAVQPPATLTLALRGEQGQATVVAQRGAGVRERIDLAAGAFCKVPYTFVRPQTLAQPVQAVLAAEPLAPARLDRPAAAAVAADIAATVAPAPDTTPASSPDSVPDRLRLDGGLSAALAHFSAYEPLYLLYGSKSPAVRWQMSFKYAIFHPTDPGAGSTPWWRSLHFGYTQTSLWNWSAPSSPFHDTSYRPELFFLREDWRLLHVPGVSRIDLQAGVQHESNGKDGADSRSLNRAYLKPTFYVGQLSGWHLRIAPRLWTYVGDLSDNRDIDDYRGHGDLTLKLMQPDGLQLAVLLRAGDSLQPVTAQFDITYPLHRLISAVSEDIYLQAQYFVGYGESLLDYRERTDSLRLGVALWR